MGVTIFFILRGKMAKTGAIDWQVVHEHKFRVWRFLSFSDLSFHHAISFL